MVWLVTHESLANAAGGGRRVTLPRRQRPKGNDSSKLTKTFVDAQVWNSDPHGEALPSRDVWALGAILYEVVYSRLPPFYADRNGSKAGIGRKQSFQNRRVRVCC